MAVAATSNRAVAAGGAARKQRRRYRPFVLWLVPILGLLFIFSVLPIFASFYLSFFDYEMLQPLKWQGLGNYIYALTHDAVLDRKSVV